MTDHKCGLEGEAAATEFVEVLQRRPQQIHDHDVDALIPGAFLPAPVHHRKPLHVVTILVQRLDQLSLMCQLRVFYISFLL